MTIEKKPLPVITGKEEFVHEPKRSQSPPKTIIADNLRKSEVSLLTSSFDSSAESVKLDADKGSQKPNPTSVEVIKAI